MPHPDDPSPVSMAAEEEEHQTMKNFLTSGEQQGLRRSRAVRSKAI